MGLRRPFRPLATFQCLGIPKPSNQKTTYRSLRVLCRGFDTRNLPNLSSLNFTLHSKKIKQHFSLRGHRGTNPLFFPYFVSNRFRLNIVPNLLQNAPYRPHSHRRDRLREHCGFIIDGKADSHQSQYQYNRSIPNCGWRAQPGAYYVKPTMYIEVWGRLARELGQQRS